MRTAERSNWENQRRHVGFGLWIMTLVLVLAVMLCGCSSNSAQLLPEQVIQTETLDGYEDQTVEEAFDSFLSSSMVLSLPCGFPP